MKTCSFIVILEEKPPEKDFSLKDLPSASKIDVVARNIQVMFPQKTNKYHYRYFAVFTKDNPMVLVVNSLPETDSFSDEIFIASYIRNALGNEIENFKLKFIDELNEITFYKLSSVEYLLLKLKDKENKLIYLHEEGEYYEEFLDDIINSTNIVFILGGRKDISEEHEKTLNKYISLRINLGETPYLASTCILKIIYELNKI